MNEEDEIVTLPPFVVTADRLPALVVLGLALVWWLYGRTPEQA